MWALRFFAARETEGGVALVKPVHNAKATKIKLYEINIEKKGFLYIKSISWNEMIKSLIIPEVTIIYISSSNVTDDNYLYFVIELHNHVAFNSLLPNTGSSRGSSD